MGANCLHPLTQTILLLEGDGLSQLGSFLRPKGTLIESMDRDQEALIALATRGAESGSGLDLDGQLCELKLAVNQIPMPLRQSWLDMKKDLVIVSSAPTEGVTHTLPTDNFFRHNNIHLKLLLLAMPLPERAQRYLDDLDYEVLNYVVELSEFPQDVNNSGNLEHGWLMVGEDVEIGKCGGLYADCFSKIEGGRLYTIAVFVEDDGYLVTWPGEDFCEGLVGKGSDYPLDMFIGEHETHGISVEDFAGLSYVETESVDKFLSDFEMTERPVETLKVYFD